MDMHEVVQVGLQQLLIFIKRLAGRCRAFDQNSLHRTARQCFESHDTGAGKQIEASEPQHILSQPIEYGLTHAIRRRPQTWKIGEAQQPAAPLAAAYAYLISTSHFYCELSIRDRKSVV